MGAAPNQDDDGFHRGLMGQEMRYFATFDIAEEDCLLQIQPMPQVKVTLLLHSSSTFFAGEHRWAAHRSTQKNDFCPRESNAGE